MWNFEAEQKAYDIGGVMVGGQPGEYPTVPKVMPTVKKRANPTSMSNTCSKPAILKSRILLCLALLESVRPGLIRGPAIF